MPPPTLDLHDIQGLFARGYGSARERPILEEYRGVLVERLRSRRIR